MEAVVTAYMDCRRHKRNTLNQLAFEVDLERNLAELWRDLRNGTYRIGRSLAFVVTFPKYREVWAADFRDRVVHHVICNAINDRFYRCFIRDSYACIPGRGTHDGKSRISRFVRSITSNWSKPAYFLQLDVANFFNSVDRWILLDIVLERVPEPWLRKLITQTVLHDPRKNAVYRSPPRLFAKVPPHKSLRLSPPFIGLPIGNLTSQFFANVYMNELDQFVKRKLKIRYYGRYVDDFILLHEDVRYLNACKTAIKEFLMARLRLRLHPNKIKLNLVEHGINFIGFIIKPHRTYLRRSTLASCKKRIRTWKQHGSPLDAPTLDGLGQGVTSYLGMLRQVNGYKARTALCTHFDNLFIRADVQLTKLIVKDG